MPEFGVSLCGGEVGGAAESDERCACDVSLTDPMDDLIFGKWAGDRSFGILDFVHSHDFDLSGHQKFISLNGMLFRSFF